MKLTPAQYAALPDRLKPPTDYATAPGIAPPPVKVRTFPHPPSPRPAPRQSAPQEASIATVATGGISAANFALKPSTDEAKLNKTERLYLWHLRQRKDVLWVGIQNITVKLADDCRLTPDFAVMEAGGKMLLIDVKGFQREDALIKMKVAARMFPMFQFWIVKRAGGGWEELAVRA